MYSNSYEVSPVQLPVIILMLFKHWLPKSHRGFRSHYKHFLISILVVISMLLLINASHF